MQITTYISIIIPGIQVTFDFDPILGKFQGLMHLILMPRTPKKDHFHLPFEYSEYVKFVMVNTLITQVLSRKGKIYISSITFILLQ